MVRLLQAEKKVTVTQISTPYNQSMRKSISEHKTHPVCSAAAAEDHTGRYCCQPRTGNCGSKLDQFTKLNSNRLEKQCLVKRFLPLLCLDSRVQISHNEWEHGFTLPCIVQASSGGVMVWRISSWHFLCIILTPQPTWPCSCLYETVHHHP